MKTNPNQSIHELLAERKGLSVAQGRQMNNQMAQTAVEVGLTFNFDKTIPANTFNAHRLIHLAAAHGRQDVAKERILYAYFTEGLNVDDPATLTQLAAELDLPAADVAQLFQTDAYAQDVRHDEYQARQIGVRGVPFFVFDDKYAVSGAQPKEVFLEVLGKVWEESQPVAVGSDGLACGPDGDC